MTDLRAAVASLVPTGLLLAALVLLAPIGNWAAPSLVEGVAPALLAGVVATFAAIHRPHGGAHLALGALALPLALELSAPLPAAVAMALAALAAEALRRPLERRRGAPLPERRGWLRAVERAALAGLATLAAGAFWLGADGAPELARIGPFACLAALVPVALFELLFRRLVRGELWSEALAALAPLGFDAGGFALGLVAVAAWRADVLLGAAVLVAFVALALEAARHELNAEATGRTLAEAERVSRSSATLVSGGSELERLALRIFGECAAIAAPSYLALELASPESGEVRFGADASGVPHTGLPEPPEFPPPLPGLHRREAWRKLTFPLLESSERHARLTLWCDPRRSDPASESSLAALLPQIQAAVREALVEREATIDRLTGAATRRALDRKLAEAFAAARDEARSLAVVMCDLDHFKKINDTHGHAVGDEALRATARVLIAPMRGGDLCGRYGGEEFVLLFEETTGDTALEIAERLRKRIEALELTAPGSAVDAAGAPAVRVPLTMSFGVAAFPALAVRSASELVELADATLYTAKRLGRNVALLDCGGGRMRTGGGETIEIGETSPFRAPIFFA